MVFSSYIYYLLCIRDSLVNLCLFLNLVSYISSSKLLTVHPCHCVFASEFLLWDSGCTAFNILRCSHVDHGVSYCVISLGGVCFLGRWETLVCLQLYGLWVIKLNWAGSILHWHNARGLEDLLRFEALCFFVSRGSDKSASVCVAGASTHIRQMNEALCFSWSMRTTLSIVAPQIVTNPWHGEVVQQSII
jgi:hypothetical protein